MIILRDISVMWSMVHTLIIFLFLFESRYSRKKTIVITLSTMIPLMLVNLALFIGLGFDKYGPLMLLTLSIPSCIVFYILSKHRDGRFFFTFCMIDTTALEIIYITNILNYYITPNSYIVMFIIRMISYPLIEILLYKKVRKMFLDIQKKTKKGWAVFAIIGASFYIAITLLMTYPTPITSRPEYMPVIFILFVLMPVIYLNIIMTLKSQQEMHEMEEQDMMLKMQVSSLTTRMDELASADEKFRIERHNFRHKLQTIAGLINKEQYTECLHLLEEYDDSLDKTKIERYCQHPILDAMLSTYITKAKDKDIRLNMGFSFPDDLPGNETELATAIANALENAINACEKIEQQKRFIEIKAINHPQFIMKISNSYQGDIEFNDDGIPVNQDTDHGFGSRFIATFCNKNGGYYQFTADGEVFTLMLNFNEIRT
ncbi:MAG: GHKL domain-containing protein [Clostridia bacterium]|nr:GHKL domain-containing protein [Clostridia bacterium]